MVMGINFSKSAQPSSSTPPRDPNPFPGYEEKMDEFKEAKLNDSVWELHSPEDGNIELDIIFFHGLQVDDFEDAFWKTWLARDDETVIWPKEWLSEQLPHARILSVTYDGSAKKNEGQTTVKLVGENLIQDIIKSTDIGQGRPVFLVGHCLGGILIKQFILSAINRQNLLAPLDGENKDNVEDNNKDEQGDAEEDEFKRISEFMNNFRGAFFYSTPHQGSPELTELVKGLSSSSPILGLLKVLDKDRGRINHEFRIHREKLKARTFGVCETMPTIRLKFKKPVVVEGSVRNDVDNFYTNTTSDHFTVCRAKGKQDSAVLANLTNFIRSSWPKRTILTVVDRNKKKELQLLQ